MVRICVDTSFLITFADPSRPNHHTAVEYYRNCLEAGHLLCLSTLVVAEFECGQPITDLPLASFHVVPFNFRHARESAKYQKFLKSNPAEETGNRNVVRNDLKILAQAQLENCTVILTEDANTLTKWAERLRTANLCDISSILLKNGFRPDELTDPAQKTLGI